MILSKVMDLDWGAGDGLWEKRSKTKWLPTFLTSQPSVMNAGKVRRTQLEKLIQVGNICSVLGLPWDNATSKPMQKTEWGCLKF